MPYGIDLLSEMVETRCAAPDRKLTNSSSHPKGPPAPARDPRTADSVRWPERETSDMARKHEYFTDLYTDALIGFAAFTHLPASVVKTALGYAIRADAGSGRILLATNSELGLA